jgi:hypothetical protein
MSFLYDGTLSSRDVLSYPAPVMKSALPEAREVQSGPPSNRPASTCPASTCPASTW